ncbi:MAG: aldo/keto reductase [Thermoprotei archaeon]
MEYRTLGSGGKKVSAIGMGTYYDPLWILTAFFGWRRNARRKVAALEAGLNAGINLIDTAEIYGSEQLVAEAVSKVGRENVYIATKVWSNHLREDSLTKALERSLNRLNTRYVDLYQVHRPNHRVPIAETMHTMEKLADAGKIVDIGVSNFSTEETAQANSVLKKHQLATVQMPYNLGNRSIEKSLLPYCNKNGISVLAYYPLGHGKLTRSESLAEISNRIKKSRSQIALNWLISKENVYPIPRASNPAHVAENAGAAGWRLSPNDMAELEKLSAF